MKQSKYFYALPCLIGLAITAYGCSVNYTVKQIDKSEIKSVMKDEGCYYFLPKTRIKVEIPLTYTERTGLIYEGKDDLKKRLKACQAESSVFSEVEFGPPLTIEKLCKAIVADNYDVSIQAPIETINWLNELLEVPNFYDILHTKKPDISFSENITDLVDKTKEYRNKSFSNLNTGEKYKIKRLSRLILEETYPQETPKRYKRPDVHSTQAIELNGKIDITAESIPDYDHLYWSKVDFGLFNSSTQSFTFSADGVLKSANTTVTNKTIEFAKDILTVAFEATAKGAGLLKKEEVEEEVGTETCKNIKADLKKYEDLENEIKKLKDTRNTKRLEIILGEGLKSDPDTLKLVLAAFDKETKRLVQSMEENSDINEMVNGKKVETKNYVAVATIVPVEFDNVGTDTVQAALKNIVDKDEKAAVVWSFLSVNDKDERQLVVPSQGLKSCVSKNINISIKQTEDSGHTLVKKDAVSDAEKNKATGFRYRIPVLAHVEVSIGEQGEEQKGTSDIQIAQYGPVAFLPSKIFGSKGSVKFGMNSSGGLDSLDITSEAIPSDTVSSSTQQLLDYEKNRLTNEKDMLELKSEIKKLKNSN